MSTFGILALFSFVVLAGGLAALMYYGTDDLPLAKILLGCLYALIAAELALVIIRYPCIVIDAIVFLSMGYKMLANIMFVIFGVIILFLLGLILAKIPWDKFLNVTPAKLIVCGVLLLGLFTYTELFNGMGSFDNYDEFREVKAAYEHYDIHFWPTKMVKHYSKKRGHDCISVYPFDVRTASGRQPFVYHIDIFIEEEEQDEALQQGELLVSGADGTWAYPVPAADPGEKKPIRFSYYPFTWKSYEGSDPVAFTDPDYVPEPTSEEMIHISPTDQAVSDTRPSDAEQQPQN